MAAYAQCLILPLDVFTPTSGVAGTMYLIVLGLPAPLPCHPAATPTATPSGSRTATTTVTVLGSPPNQPVATATATGTATDPSVHPRHSPTPLSRAAGRLRDGNYGEPNPTYRGIHRAVRFKKPVMLGFASLYKPRNPSVPQSYGKDHIFQKSSCFLT